MHHLIMGMKWYEVFPNISEEVFQLDQPSSCTWMPSANASLQAPNHLKKACAEAAGDIVPPHMMYSQLLDHPLPRTNQCPKSRNAESQSIWVGSSCASTEGENTGAALKICQSPWSLAGPGRDSAWVCPATSCAHLQLKNCPACPSLEGLEHPK